VLNADPDADSMPDAWVEEFCNRVGQHPTPSRLEEAWQEAHLRWPKDKLRAFASWCNDMADGEAWPGVVLEVLWRQPEFKALMHFDPPAEEGTSGQDRESYSDTQDRAAIEAMEETPIPPEYEHLVVNCRIRHPKFGQGKVIALRNHWPETRAEILFDNCGHKTIWLKHTRLEVMDDWG
jgi:hypothetical protein